MTTFRIPSAAKEVLPGVGDFSGCHYSQQSTKNEVNLGRVRSSSISSKDSTVVLEVLYEC